MTYCPRTCIRTRNRTAVEPPNACKGYRSSQQNLTRLPRNAGISAKGPPPGFQILPFHRRSQPPLLQQIDLGRFHDNPRQVAGIRQHRKHQVHPLQHRQPVLHSFGRHLAPCVRRIGSGAMNSMDAPRASPTAPAKRQPVKWSGVSLEPCLSVTGHPPFGILFKFLARAAMLAVGQQGMPNAAAAAAYLKKHGTAGRADIGFFVFRFPGDHLFVDGPTGPEQVFSGAGADGIFAHRAQEAFIGIAVLPGQPLGFGERYGPNKVDQDPDNGHQKPGHQKYFR